MCMFNVYHLLSDRRGVAESVPFLALCRWVPEDKKTAAVRYLRKNIGPPEMTGRRCHQQLRYQRYVY